MALNAHAVFDADFSVFLPVTSPLPDAPGSVDYWLSVATMWRVTALLGCVWVTAGLVRNEKWLLRVWWAIGLAGASIAFLGLLQKATGAEMMFWQTLDPREPPVGTFFATFYYHGNAGAFLNLALPAVLGLAFRYFTRPANPAARALWLALSVIMVVAVFSDTSRMGQAIAILMMLVLLVLAAPKVFRRARHLDWKTALIGLLALGAALWAVMRVSHLDESWQRWDQFESKAAQDGRWIVDHAAVDALPQAGPLGFGPGTFSVVFPYFLEGLDPTVGGRWLFLHNDYLQTLMEWGWVGGVLWGGIFLGGVIFALRGLGNRRRPAWSLPRRRVLTVLSLVALGGVALHATVDFPLQIASIELYVVTYLGVCWGAAA